MAELTAMTLLLVRMAAEKRSLVSGATSFTSSGPEVRLVGADAHVELLQAGQGCAHGQVGARQWLQVFQGKVRLARSSGTPTMYWVSNLQFGPCLSAKI